MVVSDAPIAWDFRRWRHTLESYRIDGQPVFDTSRGKVAQNSMSLLPGRKALRPATQIQTDGRSSRARIS
jgi:hypothetical protein